MVTVHADGMIELISGGIHITSKGIAQAQHALAGVTYHPATGYSTIKAVNRGQMTITTLAAWLNTDEATALDWLVYKVAAFRGVSENEARRMITGGGS